MSARTHVIRMSLGALAIAIPSVLAVGAVEAKPPGDYQQVECPEGLVPSVFVDRTVCGALTVPEDRVGSSEREVVLPVAIVRASAPSPAPDPVVMLTGGPGEPGLWTFLSEKYVPVIEQLNVERDVILLDQRSTGGAVPAMACPEVVQAQLDILATADEPLAERNILEAGYRACFDRLRAEGAVDLDQYDTPATVADLEALRRALSINEWNVYGYSYGTTVALEMLRSNPGHLRSVVLDAALPPFADHLSPAGVVEAGKRGFETLFDRCDEPFGCPVLDLTQNPPGLLGFVDGGQLEADLEQLQQFWNAWPYATVYPPDGRPLQLTGDDAVWALFKGQYFTDFLQVLPTFIELLAPGDPFFGFPIPQPFDVYLANVPLLLSIDRATWATVNCADRGGVIEPNDLMDVWAAEPVYRSILVDSPTFPELCDEIVMVEPNQPVFSKVLPRNVPTLVLAGENDPITPPALGEQTADLLGPSATFVLIPDIGHTAVANSGGCGEQLVADFLGDPTGDLDQGCATP